MKHTVVALLLVCGVLSFAAPGAAKSDGDSNEPVPRTFDGAGDAFKDGGRGIGDGFRAIGRGLKSTFTGQRSAEEYKDGKKIGTGFKDIGRGVAGGARAVGRGIKEGATSDPGDSDN